MGKRETGKKPVATTRRQSAKTDGAFGKERAEDVVTGDATRNRDKASGRTGGAGA